MLDQPSIQSFYGRPEANNPYTSPSKILASASPPRPGDGFTTQEAETLNTSFSSRVWHPKGEYTQKDIAAIMPGPGSVKIVGRIVNRIQRLWTSPESQGLRASGHIKMVIRDDTGIIVVLNY